MNPSASTTIIRTCRTRSSPSQSLNCLRTRSHSSMRQSPFPSSQSTTTSLPFHCRRHHEQRATFSTAPSVHDAQLIHHTRSVNSEGPNTTTWSPASHNDSMPPQKGVSSRTSTPAAAKASYDRLLLPTSMTQRDVDYLTQARTQLGTVTRVSTMQKTVRVTQKILVYHKPYQKYYHRQNHSFVHDPQNLLVEGDVIRFGEFPPSLREKRDRNGQVVVARGRPKDRNGVTKELGVRYMVWEIVTPFGVPLDQRKPRKVGGKPGAWKGTEGEAKKIAARQKGRKGGSGRKVKKPTATVQAAKATIPENAENDEKVEEVLESKV